MELLLNEIQSKIEYLQNKYNKDRESRLNKEEISDDNLWTNADAYLLNDLLNVCRYLHTVCYNSVLEQIKHNDSSIIERYCNEKKVSILEEIPKHKSKYILKELREELETLEKIMGNKEMFIDNQKQYSISYDMVLNSFSFSKGSSAVASQLNRLYFDDTLHPSYKIVFNDIINGKMDNYNKIGKISHNKYVIRDLNDLCDPNVIWKINNKIDNYLNNNLNNVNDESLFKEVSNYILRFIKYNEYLKEYGIQLPNNHGNYFMNVQSFLKSVIENNVAEKIIADLSKESNELKNSLPSEYNDIEYGFFGTVTGKPGIAYYYNSPNRIEEAKNIKYICDILLRAKELEGKNLGQDIINEVNQNIENSIDSQISVKSR